MPGSQRLGAVVDHLHPAAPDPSEPPPTRLQAAAANQQIVGPPRAWGPAEWQASEARQCSWPLLDMGRVAAAFDHTEFLRDGAAVLPAAMPPTACRAWAQAIRDVQQANDAFALADWGTLSWPAAEGVGRERLPATAAVPPLEARAQAVGRSQTLPRVAQTDDERATVQLLRRHCVVPEYFPQWDHPFLMDAMYNPAFP